MDKKENNNNFNESDLKLLKELQEFVNMLKKPFWKWVIGIIVVSSVFNIFYQVGFLIGKLIADLGL